VPTALVFASWDNGDSIGSTDTAGAFSARTIRSGQIVSGSSVSGTVRS